MHKFTKNIFPKMERKEYGQNRYINLSEDAKEKLLSKAESKINFN